MSGWMQSSSYFSSWKCTDCKLEVYIQDQGYGDEYNETPLSLGWIYCPYCGKKKSYETSAKYVFSESYATKRPVLVLDDTPLYGEEADDIPF